MTPENFKRAKPIMEQLESIQDKIARIKKNTTISVAIKNADGNFELSQFEFQLGAVVSETVCALQKKEKQLLDQLNQI
jgi:hypothetical protein